MHLFFLHVHVDEHVWAPIGVQYVVKNLEHEVWYSSSYAFPFPLRLQARSQLDPMPLSLVYRLMLLTYKSSL